MRKTKMIQDYFPGWQLWIFSLTVNLALTIQPASSIAQVTTSQSDSTQAANTNIATAALEPEILSEINRVRTNPQGYARWLEDQKQYYDGIWLRLPGEKPIRTNKGQKALNEAIAILKEQPPLPPLAISEQTAANATSELANFATANNIQYFSYGRQTAAGIVMGLVVDDLFPDRRRRHSLLSPEAENTGVVCKPDPRYAKVCAIAYSDSAIADVAETKPEAVATTDSETEASSSETNSEPTPEPPATPVTPSSEDTDTAVVEELPNPPQPQAPPPPTPSVSSEEQASQEAEDSEIFQPEPEIDAESAELADDESEAAPPSEPESPEEARPETEANESIVDSDNPEEITENSEQVATNSDSFLEARVERGSLEDGDRVIGDDGSLYDFYPLEGKAGDSFTIYLESDEFDTFLALVDTNGNTIKENDDISPENSNSQIQVTLPEDGVYNIIVNTYDEAGRGNYLLKVNPQR
ncbi:MAG: PPC domain-containing protein [Pleurocapsa sp.]